MLTKTVSIIAGGYLGTRLAQNLKQQKYQVNVSFRTNEPKPIITEVNYYPMQFVDNQLEGDMALFECDTMVICIPPGFKSGLADSYPATISALVEKAETSGVKHIIFTSSTGIYTKSQRNDEFSEFDLSQYKTKVLHDAESSVLKSRVKYKHVLRLAGLMGKGRAPGRFNIAIDASNASQLVNMVMIDDVVKAISCFIGQPVSEEAVYNVVSPNHPTKQDFYRFAQLHSKNTSNTKPVVATRRTSKWICGDLIELHSSFRYRHRDLFGAIRACYE